MTDVDGAQIVCYANRFYRAYSMQEPGHFWRELRPIRCTGCDVECTYDPPETINTEWYCTRQCRLVTAFNRLQQRVS